MNDRERLVKRARDWIYAHPITGWYLAAIGLANFALNLLDLLT